MHYEIENLPLACRGSDPGARVPRDEISHLLVGFGNRQFVAGAFHGSNFFAVTLRGRSQAFIIAFVAVGVMYLSFVNNATIRYFLPTSRALALVWQGLWDAHIFIPSNTNELEHFTEFQQRYTFEETLSAASSDLFVNMPRHIRNPLELSS